jgi:hypothetical protein
VALVTAVLALWAGPAAGQSKTDRFAGRALSEVLVTLSARGVQLVFSSQLVTPGMRVMAEPRATAIGPLLDELLAPHGLEVRAGPRGVLQVVRASDPPSAPKPPSELRHSAIRGHVVDLATGAPLQGVLVEVVAEARATRTDPRGRFTLLVQPGPHTLDVRINGYAPAQRTLAVGSTRAVVKVEMAPVAGSYSERVTVTAPPAERRDAGVAAEATLESTDVERLSSGLVNDPMRVVQALPRVAVGDDARGELSVRGSPYRHVGVVVDGVATPFLLHAAYGRGDAGSLTMLTSDVIDRVTLQAGAHPQRHSDTLGAQVELSLREGSRAEPRVRAALGSVHGTLTAEGPLGRARRGSWLVTARHSFHNWPLQPRTTAGTTFGFADGLAKVVYDVAPRHQVAFTAISGRSTLEDPGETEPNALADGVNRTSLVVMGWRSAVRARTTLEHRAYVVAHRFLNVHNTGEDASRGSGTELGYRADVAHQLPRTLLEAGAHVQRLRGSTRITADGPSGEGPLSSERAVERFDGSSWVRSGYVHLRWKPTPRLAVAPGLRVAESTLIRERAVSSWMLGAWSIRPNWRLDASAGVSHQFPTFEHVMSGTAAARDLQPERAAHVDVGIEHHLTPSVRWQATLFSRDERDVVSALDQAPWLSAESVTALRLSNRYANSLSGTSRGLELLVERRTASRLSGWVAYSYGRTRYTDRERAETYWADFDQRHAVSAALAYRASERVSVAAMFRGGTGFPIRPRLDAQDGSDVGTGRRYDDRLPPYGRLDFRASRTFTYAERPVTLFAEVLNVLNRANLGLVSSRSIAGRDRPFTRPLAPRRFAAGLQIEF